MGADPATPVVDLAGVGLDRGGHLLVARALRDVDTGEGVRVVGTDPNLGLHLRTWARGHGHDVDGDLVTKGGTRAKRWLGAERAGAVAAPDATADPRWGLAARGALVEAGGPPLRGPDLVHRDEVWADIAPKLYAQALAQQWDPATAIDWSLDEDLAPEVEDAVVQVMTYLVENEQAALAVPARHLGRIHPHYREIVAFLATQVADEARHIEVFTRRAGLRRDVLGSSEAAGRTSLQTLLDEPDHSLATFLLAVLGEGSFLDLLSFLERHAPDAVTRRIAHLARQDEARHVAFGQAHVEHRVATDPSVRHRLRAAIERRHDALQETAGLNEDVFDALVLLAAGSFAPDAVRRGWDAVQQLQRDMDEGRRRRLVRLGFTGTEAAELSALHTRNFM